MVALTELPLLIHRLAHFSGGLKNMWEHFTWQTNVCEVVLVERFNYVALKNTINSDLKTEEK